MPGHVRTSGSLDVIIGETAELREIGVCMNTKTLLHKIELSLVSSGLSPYYTVHRPGYDSFEEANIWITELWVANGGLWVGYFDVVHTNGNEIDLGQWHSLPRNKRLPRKPFRGFTYKIPNVDAPPSAPTGKGSQTSEGEQYD